MTLGTGHRVRKTSRRMADGREIIYYDDTEPFGPRTAVDTRPLPPVAGASTEMRHDPLTGEWISLAAHRNDRTLMPPPDQDPLAPTVPGGFPTEIAESSYDVVVFENRFPSFSPRAAAELTGLVDGDPLWPVRPAAGRTEVVCFSSSTAGSFGTLSVSRARTVLEAWADRTLELGQLDGVEQVVIGWKDTRETRRAVLDALPLLRSAGHVTIMEIVEDAQEMASTRRHLDEIVVWLAGHGVTAEATAE